jgi:enoyl-CoA hydratase/carnithine racemase
MSGETPRVAPSADGIATLTFNRPARLNTLTIGLRQALDAVVCGLAAHPAMNVPA